MKKLGLSIISASFHRNGISGEGFYAVLFTDKDVNGTMVAALFDEPGYCAVFNIEKLGEGNVEFGENSWRGDRYASELRPLLDEYLQQNGTNRLGPFSF